MATVYRNLQEQVYENAKDIEDLQANTINSEEVVSIVTPLIDQKLREKTSIYSEDIDGIKASVNTALDGSVTLNTKNSYNSEKVEKTRGLIYLGEYFEYHYEREPNETFCTLRLPLKSGTLALVEDIPVNTGYIKAHTIENDADKNYTTKIDLGSGNSGSTLHLEAPGDNGIGSIDIANEYVQGSTSIKFTADKLVFGNTEITEQQLQKLLQLIQNQ